mgnify:FL=1
MSLKHNILYSSLLLLGACGTIFSGSSQTITFDSNIKENIDIYANGALVCTKTPCVVDIDRGSAPLTIIAKAKGYEDSVMQDKTKINTFSWGNLLSVYSWTTDFATSSMWKYSESGVYINMRKKDMTTAELNKYNKDAKIKAFALYNFAELKLNNPEYTLALQELTAKSSQELTDTVKQADTEIELANALVN